MSTGLVEGHPSVFLTLHIRRKPLYYIINLIVPCFLLSLVAIATFLLQASNSDRLGISTVIFLIILYRPNSNSCRPRESR